MVKRCLALAALSVVLLNVTLSGGANPMPPPAAGGASIETDSDTAVQILSEDVRIEIRVDAEACEYTDTIAHVRRYCQMLWINASSAA